MQRTSRQIREEIAEAQAELHGYAAEARGILDRAKRQDRDPTTSELQQFAKLVGNSRLNQSGLAGDIKNRLRLLEVELTETESNEQQILLGSTNKNNQGQSMYQHPSGTIYRNQFQGDSRAPSVVLPVNGVLPGEARRYPQHNMVAPVRAFRNEEDAFVAGKWLKSIWARACGYRDVDSENYCESSGIQITNAMGEGTGAGGGYTVPSPISSTLIAVRETVGVARKVCNVQVMTSETLNIAKRASGLTVYAPGEAGTITDSDSALSQIELIAKKRAVLNYVSQELSDDALINIADYVFTEMAYALSNQEDNELINGTGAGATYFGVRGLLNRLGAGGVSTAATGHDTWPELDIADFAAAVGKLPDRFHQYQPSWICSASFYYATMARIAFSAGGVQMAEVLNASPNTRSFMGYPVHLTAQMPVATATATVCCLFGAFSQAVVLGDRGGIQVARSDDYRFATDQISLRATSRYDLNVHDSGDASLAGAYVGLKTAS